MLITLINRTVKIMLFSSQRIITSIKNKYCGSVLMHNVSNPVDGVCVACTIGIQTCGCGMCSLQMPIHNCGCGMFSLHNRHPQLWTWYVQFTNVHPQLWTRYVHLTIAHPQLWTWYMQLTNAHPQKTDRFEG